MTSPDHSRGRRSEATARGPMLVAGLANACASSQFSAFGVGGATLPRLLHLPRDADTWLPGALLLGVLCLTPLAEFLCHRMGPRRLLVVCLIGMLALELALAYTRGLVALLLLTFMLGAVIAPLPPATQALIDARVPEELRSQATTIWSCGTTGGGFWGAMAAGVALSHWGWTGFCLLAAPLALLALLLLLLIPVTPPRAPENVNVLALLALPLAFGGAGFTLNAAPDMGFRLPVLGSLVLALVGAAGFRAYNHRGARPVLDLGLLAIPTMCEALGLAIGIAAFSTGLLETMFLGVFDELDAGALGVRGALGGALMVLGSSLGGLLSSKREPRVATLVGLLVLCMGKLGFFFYDPGISLWLAYWPAMVSSLGYGIVTTSVTFLAFTDPRCRGAGAASLLLLAWQFGDAFGLPLVEALLQRDTPIYGSLGAYHHVFHFELTVTAALVVYCYWSVRRSRTNTSAG